MAQSLLDAEKSDELAAAVGPFQDILGYLDALVEEKNDEETQNELDSASIAEDDHELLSKPECLAKVREKEVGIYNRLLLVVEKTVHDHKRLQATIHKEKAKN